VLTQFSAFGVTLRDEARRFICVVIDGVEVAAFT
jgi:hypothetical protein